VQEKEVIGADCVGPCRRLIAMLVKASSRRIVTLVDESIRLVHRSKAVVGDVARHERELSGRLLDDL